MPVFRQAFSLSRRGIGVQQTEFKIKRVYDHAEPADGVRVLVDRLWPRGISRETAQIDRWEKALTPSHELRKWFHANPEQFAELAKRYTAELDAQQAAMISFCESVAGCTVTLITSAREVEHGHVSILKAYLQDHLS